MPSLCNEYSAVSMNRMERISGPYKGYFIAAYSVPAGDSHVGYAKVCAEQPRDVWTVEGVEKLTSATGCRSELEAVATAERKAREVIADLASGFGPVTSPGALQG
jgi:hypothetical protein